MPRVFHCDDEPIYRELVKVVLASSEGAYELVGQAADGQEAIDLAPGLAPDIVLLDVNMPGMGGIEALPRLREALPGAKIIALTTAWRASWEQHFLGLGGDGYIEKPRDAMALPDLLEAALVAGEPVDPLDVTEEMFHAWWEGDREGSFAKFADDAVFDLLDLPAPLVGVAALRDHLDRLTPEQRQTSARAVRMVGLHDAVVIEAAVEVPRGEQRERYPLAWLARVRDGKIVRLKTFRSWSEAHTAAGLTRGVTPTAGRELGRGAGWIFALARRAGTPRFARSGASAA